MGGRRKPKEGQKKYNAEQVSKETKIAADNPLFNAIMNPACALQSTSEDFLESLEQNPATALAELINLVLRACGSNDSLNSDEVLDYDGVVDALDNFTEILKQENSPIYPLTSRLPIFKKFRKSLSEFINRLIESAAELGVLYTSDLVETLQAWVIAMSSSHIRSFRHTATVIALEVETSLCDVAAAVGKEAEMVGRQQEGEKKRKGGNKGNTARMKELEMKTKEIRNRRNKLAEFLKEFVDGVFVHRYRDFDPTIRAECVRAMGLWFKKYPEHFLEASYLRYVGWVLSDSDTHVRLEAVKSLSGVYEQIEYINSLNHFTERFKPRLIEIATSDTELSIRVAVIQVLSIVGDRSLLEDEEREKLCLLMFDQEARIRKAVSRFIKSVWEEQTEERFVGRGQPSEEDRRRAGAKVLASLFVRWGGALDKLYKQSDEKSIMDAESLEEETSQTPAKRELPALVTVDQKSRMAYAVEALWDEVEGLRDWKTLLNLLLLDHSCAEADPQATSSRGKNKKSRNLVGAVDDAWRLEEVEEGILLEVFVAVLRKSKTDTQDRKKGGEDFASDTTRELIKVLPQLFMKHQTDQKCISDVLLIPTLMNLDLYLEMRMVTSYEHLWDDISRQFLSHTSSNVIIHAIGAVSCLMDTTSLSNTNGAKMVELEDELSSILRDSIAGREEIELASFTEDEILSLSAVCMRLAVLYGSRNMISWLEEDEGGKQSSAWDIISALSDRGRLGYREEVAMVEQALTILSLHIMWKAKGLTTDAEPSPEYAYFKESLLSQRETLLEKLIEYSIGTQSNNVNSVRRVAFQHLLHLHVLFSARHTVDSNGEPLPTASVPLYLDEQTQFRCAGYIQAEIEQYAESIGMESEVHARNNVSEEEPETDAHNAIEKRQVQKGKRRPHHRPEAARSDSRIYLENEYEFMDLMYTFLRAIRAGAIHVQHSNILLTHYGRLGPMFDSFCKLIIELLREEGIINGRGPMVISILVHALRSACELVLDGIVSDETYVHQLSKLLSTCLVIRGSQLSIIRRLNSKFVVQLHTELLSWIAQRLAAYESNKNKRSSKLVISFFRTLTPLLSNITSRDGLRIKAHMDQVLTEGKVGISANSKNWEPYRAYEKRLSKVISKEKGAGGEGMETDTGFAGATTTDEERGDVEGQVDLEQEEHPPDDVAPLTADPYDVFRVHKEVEAPATPKPRPKLKSSHKPRTPASTTRINKPVPTIMEAEVSGVSSPFISNEPRTNGSVQTPKSSKKRGREDTVDENIFSKVPEKTGAESTVGAVDDGEIRIRRKRVRRHML